MVTGEQRPVRCAEREVVLGVARCRGHGHVEPAEANAVAVSTHSSIGAGQLAVRGEHPTAHGRRPHVRCAGVVVVVVGADHQLAGHVTASQGGVDPQLVLPVDGSGVDHDRGPRPRDTNDIGVGTVEGEVVGIRSDHPGDDLVEVRLDG